MNQYKPEGLCKSLVAGVPVGSEIAPCSATLHSVSHPLLASISSNHRSQNDSRQKHEGELHNAVAARKVQKADREKLRRGRLNEQFTELGSVLDPDWPKNDKATILTDTILVLKDLSAEVNRLEVEYATLSEESRELTQEKNELREEKASLKTDTKNLNTQYQQRLSTMFPWTAMDHSVVLGSHSYPVPMPVPPGPLPIHPLVQPFSFYGNQNAGSITTYVPCAASANHPVEQSSAHHASTSHISSKQYAKSRLSSHQRCSNAETCDESDDVATELELKMPGSSTQQDSSSVGRKGKHTPRKDRNTDEGNSSSRYSSSQGLPDSSSNSVGDTPQG